ncbi:MAG: YicC/YloC family endoribonuclease [Myxococcota bacterium]
MSTSRKPDFSASSLRAAEERSESVTQEVDKTRKGGVPFGMPRSMTGFGRGQGDVEGTRVTAELRSVNHKFLDVRVQAAGPLLSFVGSVDRRLRQTFSRGRLELSLSIERSRPSERLSLVDVERAGEVVAALRELKSALGLAGEVELSLVIQAPGVLRTGGEVDVDVTRLASAVDEAVEQAGLGLLEMRSTEGRLLQARLIEHLDQVAKRLEVLSRRSPLALAEKQKRISERLEGFRGDTEVSEERVAQELVVWIDRLDVSEEIERLEAHLDHARSFLGEGRDEPVGRKLDFLVQEMNRETNTIGSKCSDTVMAHEVVELKSEIERMREQIQNLE